MLVVGMGGSSQFHPAAGKQVVHSTTEGQPEVTVHNLDTPLAINPILEITGVSRLIIDSKRRREDMVSNSDEDMAYVDNGYEGDVVPASGAQISKNGDVPGISMFSVDLAQGRGGD
ncbi:hypothetical protein K2173_026187 [Erythroxylum novogranatense]|uniref:Uncharacterized protein n=1 Tax=Erythroxylum novogranatense TaxID=1862640 RepID=A0AAV8T907_9ROSI|nr:hypothetical protein K2173_026187 [Erythroxylum novogranatense]